MEQGTIPKAHLRQGCALVGSSRVNSIFITKSGISSGSLVLLKITAHQNQSSTMFEYSIVPLTCLGLTMLVTRSRLTMELPCYIVKTRSNITMRRCLSENCLLSSSFSSSVISLGLSKSSSSSSWRSFLSVFSWRYFFPVGWGWSLSGVPRVLSFN